MKQLTPIPFGWYAIALGSTILAGDKFADKFGDRYFTACCSSVGHKYGERYSGLGDEYVVIRQGSVIINMEVTELIGKLKAAIVAAGHTNVKVSITSDTETVAVKNNSFTA